MCFLKIWWNLEIGQNLGIFNLGAKFYILNGSFVNFFVILCMADGYLI